MLKILLLEDDTIEIMKFKRTLNALKLNHDITIVENGDVAIKKLTSMEYVPELILLDLHMPKMNGIEFLSFIKSDERFHHIPCVLLTTSSNSSDITECYKAGIAGYLVKPLKYNDYVSMIEKLLGYWSINRLK